MGGRNGGGCLGKLVVLAIVIPLGIIAVLFFTSPSSPFFGNKNQIDTPAPVLVGTITREYKLITAQVTGQTTIAGETKNFLPFSTEHWDYQMVMTVTAGIDMTKLKDSDIKSEGDIVTIHLPPPEVLTKEKNGWVVSRNQQIFSGVSSDKNIVDKMQAAGEAKIMDNILKDGKLFREAQMNAEIQLRNFILQLGYKQVKFEETPAPTPAPSAAPS